MIVILKTDISSKKILVHSVSFNKINNEIKIGVPSKYDNYPIIESVSLFNVIDNRIPPDWVCELSDDKQVCQLYPKEFVEPIDIEKFGDIQVSGSDPVKKEYWERVFYIESTEFWERYHDGCPLAEEIFSKVTKKLKQFHGIKD